MLTSIINVNELINVIRVKYLWLFYNNSAEGNTGFIIYIFSVFKIRKLLLSVNSKVFCDGGGGGLIYFTTKKIIIAPETELENSL
jgi:hypothetical protein